jgi:hypothetical protein
MSGWRFFVKTGSWVSEDAASIIERQIKLIFL